MHKLVFAAIAFTVAVSAGWTASRALAQQSEPLQRLAQASYSGTYEGNVDRRYVATRQAVATRLYRIAVNPDLVNGTVWIYENGSLLHILLIKGSMQRPGVFVGTTRPVESAKPYSPDNIRLEFSSDGQSVAWYHHDGTLEGSGRLVRR
jgi:hypothetical protein